MTFVPAARRHAWLSLTLAVCTASAQATSDIAVLPAGPTQVRVLPGESVLVSVVVENLGPDPADVVLRGVVYWPNTDYTIALAQPECGELTHTGGNDVAYAVALPTMQAGADMTCTFVVSRGTTPLAASDLWLSWFVDPGDPDPNNDWASFAIGSLVDVSIGIEPQSFEIDASGIAHEFVLLHVADHGPSDVFPFSVGACTDNGFPGFYLDGEFPGGCGALDYGPSCFEFGFGFLIPTLVSGEKYSCAIEMTSMSRYEEPNLFGVYTDLLLNPATQGGELIDRNPDDNQAPLRLAPFSGPIFINGFESPGVLP